MLVSESLENFKRTGDTKGSVDIGGKSSYVIEKKIEELKKYVGRVYKQERLSGGDIETAKSEWGRFVDNIDEILKIVKELNKIGVNSDRIEILGPDLRITPISVLNGNHVVGDFLNEEDAQKCIDFMKKYSMEKYKDNFKIGQGSSLGKYYDLSRIKKLLENRKNVS